jgi:hypothetical protein
VSLRFLLFISIVFLSLNLSSHQRSESFSKWSITQSELDKSQVITATFTVKLTVLAKMYPDLLGDWESRIIKEVLEGFVLPSNCISSKDIESFISNQNGSFNISWHYSCEEPITEIDNNTFFDQDLSHSHIARFTLDSMELPEILFTASSRHTSLKMENDKSFQGTSFLDYLLLGLQHISSGFDHLAFLIGLILLNRRLKSLFIAVTGFTIGHSLTLVLGVLGFVTPMTNWVEAVIGFSIALIALELILKETGQTYFYLKCLSIFWGILFLLIFSLNINISLMGLIGLSIFSLTYLYLVTIEKVRLSLFITTLFGLVHGFGFGGYLSQVGFQESRFLNALLGFNLGVELGQLLIIGFILFISFIFNKKIMNLPSSFRPYMGCLLVGVGTFWFLERSF